MEPMAGRAGGHGLLWVARRSPSTPSFMFPVRVRTGMQGGSRCHRAWWDTGRLGMGTPSLAARGGRAVGAVHQERVTVL